MNTTTHTIAGYTGFKRNVLYAIAAKGGTPDADPMACPYGLSIKRRLETWYGVEVNHGRLYPNLDAVVDDGFVTKHAQDKRTNGYRLTQAGIDAIVAYHTDVVGAALQEAGVFADVVPPEVVDAAATAQAGGI